MTEGIPSWLARHADLIFLEEALNSFCETSDSLVLLRHHLWDVNVSAAHNDSMASRILLNFMKQMAGCQKCLHMQS